MQRELMQKKLQRAFDVLDRITSLDNEYVTGLQIGIAIAIVKDIMEMLEEITRLETEKKIQEERFLMSEAVKTPDYKVDHAKEEKIWQDFKQR